jgi:hypothetical protein
VSQRKRDEPPWFQKIDHLAKRPGAIRQLEHASTLRSEGLSRTPVIATAKVAGGQFRMRTGSCRVEGISRSPLHLPSHSQSYWCLIPAKRSDDVRLPLSLLVAIFLLVALAQYLFG